MAKENSHNLLLFGGGFQAEAQLEAVSKTTNIKKAYSYLQGTYENA